MPALAMAEKSSRLVIRISETEKAQIQAQADLLHLSLSAYVRMALLNPGYAASLQQQQS